MSGTEHIWMVPGPNRDDRSQKDGDKIVVLFKSHTIHSQGYKSINIDNDHMYATVVYDLIHGDQIYRNLETSVRQCYQTNFDTDPIELTTPSTGGYKGPFPIHEFDDAVIEYLRSRLGNKGTGIGFSETGYIANIQVTNTRIAISDQKQYILWIPATNEPCGGWLLDSIPRWRKPHEKPASKTTPLSEVREVEVPVPSPAERLDRDD